MSDQRLDQPAIITCNGSVYAKPRLVRRRKREEPRKLFDFSLKFRHVFYQRKDGSYPDMGSEACLDRFEHRVRSTIEVDHIYTDPNGVIHEFDPPEHSVWWIEVGSVSTKLLKPVPVWQYEPEANGPLIEGEILSSEVVTEPESPTQTE